jgi:hypothetical protein
MDQLVLKRASASRPSGQWDDPYLGRVLSVTPISGHLGYVG